MLPTLLQKTFYFDLHYLQSSLLLRLLPLALLLLLLQVLFPATQVLLNVVVPAYLLLFFARIVICRGILGVEDTEEVNGDLSGLLLYDSLGFLFFLLLGCLGDGCCDFLD